MGIKAYNVESKKLYRDPQVKRSLLTNCGDEAYRGDGVFVVE